MSPLTHILISWSVANAAPLDKRGRGMVMLSGVLPDADGIGIVPDLITRSAAHPTNFWGDYHHILGHNVLYGLMLAALAAIVAKTKRGTTFMLALAAFHIHLICDIVGARGPEGEQWPIPYLLPFSKTPMIAWDGQWALNAWPNFLITGLFLAMMFYIAARLGRSPLEYVSVRADRTFVETVRARLGRPSGPEN